MSSVVARAGGIIVDDATAQKRAEAMKARNDQRVKERLSKGPRERAIGIEKDAINRQISQKEAAYQREVEAEEEDVRRSEETRRYANQLESMEHMMRKEEMKRLANDWYQQKQEHDKKYFKGVEPHVDPDRVGVSATQKFNGEDAVASERRRSQQAQLRQWISQLSEEKRQLENQKHQDHVDYGNYINRLTNLVAEMENTEKNNRWSSMQSLKDENMRLAERRKQLEEEKQASEAALAKQETDYQLNNPVLLEDRTRVNGMSGLMRVDHFKGLTQDERNQILATNKDIAERKLREKQKEEANVEEYSKQTKMLCRQIEILEFEENQRKKAAIQDQLNTLSQQKQEAKEREERNRKNGRGSFESGFFDKFGRSVR